ncbi:branched-chain amino acid ABC transporter permease [Streptomyces sp. NBC_00656]|uniref:branched-chain amino acid ABC transporter permease n=1 Tax=Streptomyces sp. NBC_00656 TaxID=2903668 RepID=UPI00386A1044
MPPAGAGARKARSLRALLTPRRLLTLVAFLLLLAPPFYLAPFWLQTGLFAMAAVVASLGLNLLVGTAGQLSLGHAFFMAVGAYGYAWLADDTHQVGMQRLVGGSLPTLLAFPAAVLLAGAAGALFSPLSGRLRGMYLGVATLALVFIGHHVMLNAETFTGGYNGRPVPPMEIFGLSLSDADDGLSVLGVPFGALERLWFFGLAVVVVACLAARNLLHGRPGRALGGLRDSEVAAAVMGVPATRSRAAVFTVSSMYAGAAGALLALAFQRVVPDYFGLLLSMDLLAMIVIGGLGSVSGAVLGAVFVSMLPQLLSYYAGALPLVVAAGSTDSGVAAGDAARYLYGAALVAVLIFAPGGLAGLTARLRRRRQTRPAQTTPSSTSAGGPAGGSTLKEHTP